jgi:hypothetical protein
VTGRNNREHDIAVRYSSRYDFIQVEFHTLITTRNFTKKSWNYEPTNLFSPELHQDSLERPLLYMVVVGNDESYGNDFFKANERQRARGVVTER